MKFIVPKIIPEGLTILAGRPKIGKSWLVLLLGLVLSNGVAALGLDYGTTRPIKGSVLYPGLEDGKRRLQSCMTKLIGVRPENWPEELHLKTEWRRLDQGGLDDIRAWHQSVKDSGGNPILVVIDTLVKVRASGSSKHSPYQNDHDALAGLQKLAEELSIAIVLNHHDRKMDADDVFDTVSALRSDRGRRYHPRADQEGGSRHPPRPWSRHRGRGLAGDAVQQEGWEMVCRR